VSETRVINVSDRDVDDLRRRLRDTRWPTPWPSTSWEAGTDLEELRRLVEFWAHDFDWEAQQRLIDALPWHEADLGGTPVAYLRFCRRRVNTDPQASGNFDPLRALLEGDQFGRLGRDSSVASG
jgi:Epoxide hydrolase N terminus